MNDYNPKKVNAIAELRNVIERFIAIAQLPGAEKDPVALKKMLETSVEVQPAMEKVVKAVTGQEHG